MSVLSIFSDSLQFCISKLEVFCSVSHLKERIQFLNYSILTPLVSTKASAMLRPTTGLLTNFYYLSLCPDDLSNVFFLNSMMQ